MKRRQVDPLTDGNRPWGGRSLKTGGWRKEPVFTKGGRLDGQGPSPRPRPFSLDRKLMTIGCRMSRQVDNFVLCYSGSIFFQKSKPGWILLQAQTWYAAFPLLRSYWFISTLKKKEYSQGKLNFMALNPLYVYVRPIEKISSPWLIFKSKADLNTFFLNLLEHVLFDFKSTRLDQKRAEPSLSEINPEEGVFHSPPCVANKFSACVRLLCLVRRSSALSLSSFPPDLDGAEYIYIYPPFYYHHPYFYYFFPQVQKKKRFIARGDSTIWTVDVAPFHQKRWEQWLLNPVFTDNDGNMSNTYFFCLLHKTIRIPDILHLLSSTGNFTKITSV